MRLTPEDTHHLERLISTYPKLDKDEFMRLVCLKMFEGANVDTAARFALGHLTLSSPPGQAWQG